MKPHRELSAISHAGGRFTASARALANEVAVAISYNGTSQAVLMATPSDLADLAIGFSLTEGIISAPAEIERIETVDCGRGLDVQLWLAEDAAGRLAARRRSMAGPVGCGLCGIESLEEAMRATPQVTAETRFSAADVASAVDAITGAQALHRRTRSVHAAGCFCPRSGLIALREDVGRHNALDKLIGALTATGQQAAFAGGALVLTSRLSVELIQKAAIAGCGVLIAMSAPTALAVETADHARITLVGSVRKAGFEIYTHPERIIGGALLHVA